MVVVRTLCSSLTSQTLSALQCQLLSVLPHGGRVWRFRITSHERLAKFQLDWTWITEHTIRVVLVMSFWLFIPRQNRQLQTINYNYSIVLPLQYDPLPSSLVPRLLLMCGKRKLAWVQCYTPILTVVACIYKYKLTYFNPKAPQLCVCK